MIVCECQFCEEFNQPSDKPGRILWRNNHFTLLPSLGSFVPGYLLLMPLNHVRSFADLPADELAEAHMILERARGIIETKFGPTIVAEHGPGAPGMPTSACCDHAHFHFIPTIPDQVYRQYEQAGGPPILLPDFAALNDWRAKPYLYLSPTNGVHQIWPGSEKFAPQFVRRVCSAIAGIPELYDWAVFPFEDFMSLSRYRLKSEFVDVFEQVLT